MSFFIICALFDLISAVSDAYNLPWFHSRTSIALKCPSYSLRSVTTDAASPVAYLQPIVAMPTTPLRHSGTARSHMATLLSLCFSFASCSVNCPPFVFWHKLARGVHENNMSTFVSNIPYVPRSLHQFSSYPPEPFAPSFPLVLPLIYRQATVILPVPSQS